MNLDTKVVEAVKQWAGKHPTPDMEILRMGNSCLTPKQIGDEIDKGTDIGKSLRNLLSFAVERGSVDDVVNSFAREK